MRRKDMVSNKAAALWMVGGAFFVLVVPVTVTELIRWYFG
jgi:hypothetical protein